MDKLFFRYVLESLYNRRDTTKYMIAYYNLDVLNKNCMKVWKVAEKIYIFLTCKNRSLREWAASFASVLHFLIMIV